MLPAAAGAEVSSEPLTIVPGNFAIASSSTQAGAHENLTTSFDFEHEPNGATHDDVREVTVNLPEGFDGNNTAVPTCSPADLLSFTGANGQVPLCPIASQIGLISFHLINPKGAGSAPAEVTVPLYNMEVTSFGVTAEFGFRTQVFSQTLLVEARPEENDALTVITPNIPRYEIRDVSVTVWGVPAAHEHDPERGETCGAEFEVPAHCRNEFGGPQEAKIAAKPYLSTPTSCSTFTATMSAYSWEEPARLTEASAQIGPVTGCDRVPFDPSIEVKPTSASAESPTGLDVSLLVPQAWENPNTLSTANLADTTVTLPEGMTINPSAGSGLGSCSPAQYAEETWSSGPGVGCPEDSKIGSITIETPVLAEALKGSVYVATPYDNPFPESPTHPGGSLLALYVVARDPARRILVKTAGRIAPNPETGRLVTTFEDTPQQPFSKFTLEFRSGPTAPLTTPATCGSYAAQAALTPWSALNEPQPLSSPAFEITQGVHEGPCPSGGVPPFSPRLVSGTLNPAASSYSPFYLRIVREDGEQEITKFSTTLPPGLTGNLTGIPFCPDADIEASRGVNGAYEEEHPSCPAASEIGHTITEAGVGTVLAQAPGKIYLAGPYHGAPLSIVSITSAKVGPFDLGTVVIRFALNINPSTAQVEVSGAQSDPIPHIIDGIVTHVRDVRVYMTRPGFTLNPTNCEPLSVTDAITGAGQNPASPADQDTVNVSTPFHAANCSSLQFKPTFKVTTSGRTSKALGASLTAKVTVPGALGTQANIAKVKVDLPKQLPSRLTTLQKACTAAQFNANPAGCPAASVVGHATAITPLIPEALTGPAYFVSHGGEAFPSLIVVLQGYGIKIDLVGTTYISKAGITSSTFKAVPDQPVTSFELTLLEGKYSALAANGNLCAPTKTATTKKIVKEKVHGKTKQVTTKTTKQVAESLAMPTAFVAQNGMEIHESTKIAVASCPKAKKVKAKPRKHRKLSTHRKGSE